MHAIKCAHEGRPIGQTEELVKPHWSKFQLVKPDWSRPIGQDQWVKSNWWSPIGQAQLVKSNPLLLAYFFTYL